MTELFEKYYQNELSTSERLDFDQKLNSDPEFAQAYEAYIMMMDYMESKDDINNALNNLNDVHEEFKQNDSPTNKNRTTIFKFLKSPLAVVFILLICIALFYFYTVLNSKIDSPEEIFATHFTPAPVSLTTKGDDIEKFLAQINLDYSANKHESVINALDQINIDSLGENRLYLMLASSYIATGAYSKSRSILKPLESLRQFRNDYYWYTALSYLGEARKDEANTFLTKIPKDSNYFDRAKSILEK